MSSSLQAPKAKCVKGVAGNPMKQSGFNKVPYMPAQENKEIQNEEAIQTIKIHS